MKKVLALVVAFALCFTALAGCFVTSAEGTAEVTFTNATASNGEALITASVDSGKTATYAAETVITVNGEFEFVELVGLTKYDPDSDEDFDYTVETSEDATVVKVLNTFENVAVLSYTIKLNAPVNATCKEEVVDDAINVVMEYAEFEEAVLCNAEGTTSVTLAANGEHAYDDGVEDPEASCTADGVITYTCGVCSHSYTEATEATGHTAGEAVEENRVDATVDAPGSYDMVVYCTVCGAEMSRTTNEIPQLEPEEPVGPEVDETLTFASVSLGYGTSSLQMSFRVNNTVLDSYADMDLVIVPQKYDLTTLNVVETPAEIVVNKANLSKAGSTRKQYIHTDIFLYELGLDINYMLRAYDENGELVAVSETFTISPASFLKNTYAGSNDAKLRTLIADTLVVGDAAADNTAATYPNSDLANAASIIDGFDTSEATQTVADYNTINQFNSYNGEYTTANSAVHQVRTSVQIGKVPFINFRIGDTDKVLDLNKLAITVTYTSKDSSGEHPYSRTFTGSDFTYAGKYINCKFDEVGLHDSDKDIVFTVTYNGESVCDLTYSIETYLGSMMSNATVGELTTALIKLGQSFRSYQGL